MKKKVLTLESDYNYNQTVTKRNENDLNEIINELKIIQNKNSDFNREISNKKNLIRFFFIYLITF